MNISEHKSFFIQEMNRLRFSIRTVKLYSDCIDVFFRQSNKDHPKNVNESDIRDFLCKYQDSNTQRVYHSAIKKFYEICMKQKNKFRYIPYAKKIHKLPIILSQDEVQRMFDVCENLKHRVILSLLYSTGIRVSELINLKWSHVDHSRMIINVVNGKGQSDRQVMLATEIVPVLMEYKEKYQPVDYVLNGQFPEKELRYSQTSVLNVMKQLAEKAGISKRVFTHLMRHNSLTHMTEAGTEINLVQRIAGHKSPKTTAIYLHLSDSLISKIHSPISNIKMRKS